MIVKLVMMLLAQWHCLVVRYPVPVIIAPVVPDPVVGLARFGAAVSDRAWQLPHEL